MITTLSQQEKEKIEGIRNVKVLSFGCGVDSVAGYLVLQDEDLIKDYDEIIWADTGSEFQKLTHILIMSQKTLGWNVKIIKSKLGNIYDHYKSKRLYPTVMFRDCTGKFKLDPINRYLRTMWGKKAHFDVSIFINYSEAARRMRVSKYKYSTLVYPLVDRKITKERCVEIIKEHNQPVPHNSGCFFCWVQPPKSWQKLKETHPDLFEKARKMELESRTKDLRKYPLIRLKAKDMKLHPMDEFLENDDSCGCFNYNLETEADDWKDKPF